MAVQIRDAEVERLMRELSDRTGESITEAVRTSIAERLARIAPDTEEIARRKRRLREITGYFDALPRATAEGVGLMVVDTSALAAILFNEPERPIFEDLILQAPAAATSTAVVLETDILLRRRFATYEGDALDEALSVLGIEIVPFCEAQAKLARAALAAFGQGRHPAGLTFGDCVVMGLARQRNAPLLFKGDGFALTDIEPAWLPEA